MKELTGRSAMKSPGAPSHRREVERAFWKQIATGVTSEDGRGGGRRVAGGRTRWFRHGGGCHRLIWLRASGRYLSFVEREEIALLRAQGGGVREIARQLGRDPSTSRASCDVTLRPGAASSTTGRRSRSGRRSWSRSGPKTAKLVATTAARLRAGPAGGQSSDVPTGTDRRAGDGGVDGSEQAASQVTVGGSTAWSPEQISHRLKVDFPDDESMRICHEAIYQALYIEEPRCAASVSWSRACGPGERLRVPRARARRQAWAHVTRRGDDQRTARRGRDRAVPGHWEGDLIIGLNRSAIGTLVERTTRFTMLVHLPREEGYGMIPRTKNGPALAGYGAITMKNALAADDRRPARAAAPFADLGPWQGTLRSTPHSLSRPGSRSSSPTPTAPGSAAPTRTPTACCASTSPKAPTSPDGPPTTSCRRRRAQHTTTQDLGWRTPAEALNDIYAHSNKQVLRPPIESALGSVVGVVNRVHGRVPTSEGHHRARRQRDRWSDVHPSTSPRAFDRRGHGCRRGKACRPSMRLGDVGDHRWSGSSAVKSRRSMSGAGTIAGCRPRRNLRRACAPTRPLSAISFGNPVVTDVLDLDEGAVRHTRGAR